MNSEAYSLGKANISLKTKKKLIKKRNVKILTREYT
jgi:hypothetical protein